MTIFTLVTIVTVVTIVTIVITSLLHCRPYCHNRHCFHISQYCHNSHYCDNNQGSIYWDIGVEASIPNTPASTPKCLIELYCIYWSLQTSETRCIEKKVSLWLLYGVQDSVIMVDFIKPETQHPIIVIILITYSP